MCRPFCPNGRGGHKICRIKSARLFKIVDYKALNVAVHNRLYIRRLIAGAMVFYKGVRAENVRTNLAAPLNLFDFAFKFGVGRFALGNLGYAVILVLAWTATRAAVSFCGTGVGGFILSVVIVAILPNLVYLLFLHRTREFAYLYGVGRRMLGRVVKRLCRH